MDTFSADVSFEYLSKLSRWMEKKTYTFGNLRSGESTAMKHKLDKLRAVNKMKKKIEEGGWLVGWGSQRKSSAHDKKESTNKQTWKGAVGSVSRCRSGGATPALPLPKSFLPLSPSLLLSQRKPERKCWQSPPPPPLPNLCLPWFPSFSPHFILLHSPFLLTPHYHFIYCLFFGLPPLLTLSCLTLLNQWHVSLMETRPWPIPP